MQTKPIRNGQPRPRGPRKANCEVFVVDKARVRRARKAMLSDGDLHDVADTFKVLASPTRVRIIRALGSEELCVCDLAQTLGLSVSAVSHQLQTLRTGRIVRYRTEGKLAYYRLRDRFVLALLEDAVQHIQDGPNES